MEKYLDYKLCYIDSSEYTGEPMTLYFTELDDVTKQWGDDWDDAPYEHNAGTPYENDYDQPEQGVKNGMGIYPKIDIYKVVVDGGHNIMTPRTNQLNSPYSVEDINKGVVPWLTIKDKNNKSIFVKAGSTLKETLEALGKSGDYIDIFFEATKEEYKNYSNIDRND